MSTINIDDIFNDQFMDDAESPIEEEIKENPNIKKVETVSFKKPISTAEEVKKDKPKSGKKFILKEVIIDKFNVKRNRIELTPSVCDICAFDVAAKKYGNFHNAPVSEHDKIRMAVIEHKRVAHPLNQTLIVDEEEIPKAWLGQSR